MAIQPAMVGVNPRQEGVLVSWDDERGFGFIEVAGASGHVFLHIKFLRSRHQRPVAGDRISFTPGSGRDGGPAAIDATIVGAPPPPRKPQPTTVLDISRLMAAVAVLTAPLIAWAIGRAPLWLPSAYMVMSLGSMIAYWLDKMYAREGRQRVSENMLHITDAAFGIAGGLFAQHVFRHKTRKRAFRTITRLIFLGHAILIALVLGGVITLPVPVRH